MYPTQFRSDALLKHPLADSHLDFHWAPRHDSEVLSLHSRGHTLLMWCRLASLTCCGGREPYMPLQEDRSPRRCWRWTAPASGRCHRSLWRTEYSSGHWIFYCDTEDTGCDWAGEGRVVLWINIPNTHKRWVDVHTQSHTATHRHPPTICISIKRPMLLSVNVSVWAWDRDMADTSRAQWHVLTEVW